MGAWSDGARGGRERGCREGTYCDCGLLPWEYESLGDGVCCGLIADCGREEDACAYIALEGGAVGNVLKQSQYIWTASSHEDMSEQHGTSSDVRERVDSG